MAAAIWYPYRALPQDRVTAWAGTTFTVARRAGGRRSRQRGADGAGTEVLRSVAARAVVARGGAGAGAPRRSAGGLRRRLVLHHARSWTCRSTWVAGGPGRGPRRHHHPPRPPRCPPPDAGVWSWTAPGSARGCSRPTPRSSPVRGQVVFVEQFGLERWWLDGVRGARRTSCRAMHDIVVGGTERGATGAGPRRRRPRREILARAARLVPQLRGARVLQHRVGLRPARPAVRLEREGRVVHCYGHGGAGVTLSWGCRGRGRGPDLSRSLRINGR